MRTAGDMRQGLVLLVLDGLERRNLAPMREYELHQLVRRLQAVVGASFRYLDKPISYSYELHSFLRSLEQSHYLDELILVRNGWVPRLEYKLNVVGRAQAMDERERFQESDPTILHRVDEELDRFASSYRPPVAISPH
ncbi:MAG: hypothetical protein V3W34_05310 [Phycisphaerae bacterium]